MSDATESSCSGQIAVFGHTSCTVHNIPNNSGSLEFHEIDSNILMKYGILALIGVIGLYFLKTCIDSHFRVKESVQSVRPYPHFQTGYELPNVRPRSNNQGPPHQQRSSPTIEII